MVCFCLYLFQMIYSEVKEKTIADLNSQQLIHAKQAGRGIEEYFSDLITFLTKVSESGHVISLDDQGRKELDFALKINREGIKAITRVDEMGRILYTLPYDGTAIGKDISYQKHIREIMKTRKPVVSDVFTAVQGYNAVALHVPVFKGNEYRGTLAFLIDFQAISKRFLKDIRIGETGYAWMTSREGIELYCPVPGHTGKSVFENCKDFPSIISMAKEMVKGRQGVTSYLFDQIRDRKIKTVRKYAVYMPVKIGDSFWSIVVASSEDEALASPLNFRNKLIVVVGLLLLCSALIFFYGMRAWGIIREEAKRQKIEEVLRESEKKYRILFEGINDAVFVHDLDEDCLPGRFLQVNDVACRRLGYTREELMSLTPRDITMPEEYERIADKRIGLASQGDLLVETIHVTKDGLKIPVESNIRKFPYLDRQVALSISRDITERKQAEEALRQAEENFRRSLDESPLGVRIVTEEGETVYANRAILDMHGYDSNEEYKTTPVEKRYTPESYAEFKIRRDKRRQGVDVQFEYAINIIRKNGEVRHLQVFRKEILWDGKRQFQVIYQDITERKRAEAEKVKLQAQLNQAQKMEAIGQLAGGIAHDFNNMLNIILGYSKMALMKLEPSNPLNASLQEIMNAGLHSSDLVRQLLAFARKQTIAPKVMDLNDTVAGMLNMLRKLIGEDIDLLWMPAANLWPVKMDPAQVDQILANLAVNARDSISGVGKVTIETGKAEFNETYCAQHAGFVPGHYAMLAVSDNGCGMDKDTLEKIFEPFFTTKEIGKGTGMGLATVYGIIKQNNGFINVYSEPGKGTTFKIYLPCREEEEMASDEPRAQAKPLTGTETVLLVEDNEALLEMSKMMLEELGYTVLAAGSPNEAIKLAEQYAGDIHLVLTDVVMPDMSGRDLQKRLSALWPSLKFLFMSGYTANVIAHRGILDEGVHFLQKPFFMNGIAAKVREALERVI